MRYILLFSFLLQSLLVFADRNCGTESFHQITLKNDPSLIQKDLDIETYTRKYIEKNIAALKLAQVDEIIIPVVFHVVYYSSTQNISDVRIEEQLEVLNEDFNALNSDISNVPYPFQSSIGKLNVKFVFANRDPNGNVVNGINRVNTTKSIAFDYAGDEVKYSSKLGVDAWDTDSYLNIWVCNIKDYSDDTELLGYATFPISAGASNDGVVLNYKYVGVSGAQRPFNLGRTATHEVGHYFNLRHIWGDRDNCTASDYVDDTPTQYAASSGDPSFPKTDNCVSSYPGIMFMNYMDYCNDASLYMFTNDQATRMSATLSGPRASLLNSKGYVVATDFDVAINGINSPSGFICNNSFTPSVNVVSTGNNLVTEFSVDFVVDNLVNQTVTWTGAIGLNGSVNIVFNPIEIDKGNYNIVFEVYNTNGVDSDPTNNKISKDIQVGTDSKSLPLTESFETFNVSKNGFSVVNLDNGITWARSGFKSSTDGNYSVYMNNFEYDPSDYSGEQGVTDDIVFPFLNLTEYDQATLTFDLAATQWSALSTSGNNWDSLQVLVSIDCGQTFSVIYNKFASTLITVPISTSFFTPSSSSQWRSESVNLSQFSGSDNVLIKIRNISNFENNIYIDKLNVSGIRVTSVKDAISDAYIQMYPNPAKGEVTISIDNKIRPLKQIQWINALGQTIDVSTSSVISNNMQFDFSNQAKGIYIANFIFEDGTIASKKLILN